jgi:DNA primase
MLADEVAQEYLSRVKIKTDFISAVCPFHKGGQETRPSFWVNRAGGYWGCFTCGTRGGSLKWLLKELGIRNPGLVARIEDADELYHSGKQTADKVRAQRRKDGPLGGEHTLPESLLGVYDWLPVDLVNEGFSPTILQVHDVGYDRDRNRITFPIRDLNGDLIGISGRTTIGVQPKYLVYSGPKLVNGERKNGELGEWYPNYSNSGVRDQLWRMDKCWQLLNCNEGGQGYLILVEGYKAALWMAQHGWGTTVALMGAYLSPGQERIVRRLGVPTYIFLDNNRAGRRGSRKICQRLGVSSFRVYEVTYPTYCDEDAQPDDLEEKEIDWALTHSQRVGGRV